MPEGITYKVVRESCTFPQANPQLQQNKELVAFLSNGCCPPIAHGAPFIEGMREVLAAASGWIHPWYVSARPNGLRMVTVSRFKYFNCPWGPMTLVPCATYGKISGAVWKAGELVRKINMIHGIVEDDARLPFALPADYPHSVFLVGDHYTKEIAERLATLPFVVMCPTPGDLLREIRNEFA